VRSVVDAGLNRKVFFIYLWLRKEAFFLVPCLVNCLAFVSADKLTASKKFQGVKCFPLGAMAHDDVG